MCKFNKDFSGGTSKCFTYKVSFNFYHFYLMCCSLLYYFVFLTQATNSRTIQNNIMSLKMLCKFIINNISINKILKRVRTMYETHVFVSFFVHFGTTNVNRVSLWLRSLHEVNREVSYKHKDNLIHHMYGTLVHIWEHNINNNKNSRNFMAASNKR